jgi:hypothetical protein
LYFISSSFFLVSVIFLNTNKLLIFLVLYGDIATL